MKQLEFAFFTRIFICAAFFFMGAAFFQFGCEEKIDRPPNPAPVVASFTPDSPQVGAPGLQIQFQNLSTGADSFEWDFGAAGTSTDENPFITFTVEGSYSVKLVAHGDGGSDELTRAVLVIVDNCFNAESPVANFSPSSSSIYLNQSVAFTDLSIAGPERTIVSREWNFGDGSSSSVTNPSRVFSKCETFQVSLKVTNDCGKEGSKFGSVVVTARQSTQSIVKGNLGTFFPVLTKGDIEIGGGGAGGPRVSVWITLSTSNSDTRLNMQVRMRAVESCCDLSTGDKTFPLFFLADASAGYKFTGFPKSSGEIWYTDNGTGGISGSWNGISWTTWGDTEGDDICDNDFPCDPIVETSISINSVNFTASTVQICP